MLAKRATPNSYPFVFCFCSLFFSSTVKVVLKKTSRKIFIHSKWNKTPGFVAPSFDIFFHMELAQISFFLNSIFVSTFISSPFLHIFIYTFIVRFCLQKICFHRHTYRIISVYLQIDKRVVYGDETPFQQLYFCDFLAFLTILAFLFWCSYPRQFLIKLFQQNDTRFNNLFYYDV